MMRRVKIVLTTGILGFAGGLLTAASGAPPSFAAPQSLDPASLDLFREAGPAQLNVQGFASCLQDSLADRPVDLRSLRTVHQLGATDGLLLYLSVYPGVRPGGRAGWLLQQTAHFYWQTSLEAAEGRLLERLLEAVEQSESTATCDVFLTPGELFRVALESCRENPPWGRGWNSDADPLCASVVAHNVLRTLGRHRRAIGVDPWLQQTTDLNPQWFQRDRSYWLKKIPRIQQVLIPLRSDGEGDRYGEWYHFFGILAFGLRDQAVNGNLTQTWIAVRMNQLLNPILAGGEEEPEKARLDRDTARVVGALLQPVVLRASGDCRTDSRLYVNEM